jgi:2-methylaconitate cis-trans-isomerase PrpF
MVEAANRCIFVAAEAMRMSGTELPEELKNNRILLESLEAIRTAASLRMGISATLEEAARKPSIPKIVMVTAGEEAHTRSGETLSADSADITVGMISLQQPHRADPLTGAMSLAVASRIEGSLVWHDSQLEWMNPTVRIPQWSGERWHSGRLVSVGTGTGYELLLAARALSGWEIEAYEIDDLTRQRARHLWSFFSR